MYEKPSYEKLEQRVQELEQTVSEFKDIKGKLRENEEKYRTLSLNIPGMIYRAMPDWSVEIISNSEIVCGYSNNEFITKKLTWLDLIHIDDKQQIFEEGFKLTEKQMTIVQKYRIYAKDGTTHWVSDHKTSFFREDGSLISIDGIVYDITEFKNKGDELLRNEERFRDIAESMADWIWEVDNEGRYTYCSEKIESILGYTVKEIIGKTPFDFMSPNDAEKNGEIFGKIITEKGIIKNLENWNLSKDGRDVCLITTGVPILDKSGDLIGYRGVDSDITNSKKAEIEQKKLKERLQQSQKMESIGILAGGIAHDFNNILYPIIGFTEMSIEDLPKTHPVQENLQDILDGAKRASDLVKQILKFSRQEKQVLKPIILKPVVGEAIKLLRSTIPANIDIQGNLYDEKDYVLCDATEIHEIVMNLCTNAYHSMEENGGTIIVRLNKQNPSPDLKLPSGEYICLSVSDNGVGIPKDIIDKIFEPYLTTKEIGKGSGLGLSVVHGIIINYKGNISVESSPGKGSEFNVFLPITTQLKTVEQQLIKDKPLGGTENILFVDDEASIIKLATRILERFGYTITGKTSCIEALELFTENPDGFDLVVTDMAMPIMTGTEFAKKILKIQPDIPIIMCTGFSEQVDSEIAKSIGIKEYIKKPILIDELTSKIREVLDQFAKGGK
jgi:PAS domain S-box-containing protein